jgi:cytochrome c553
MNMRTVLVACALLICADALADAKAGEKKAQLCLLCHKPANVMGAAPLLEAQPSKYLVRATIEYQTGKRPDPMMKGNVADLSARDIGDIADYFASRAPMPGVWSTDPAKVAAGGKRAAEGRCASCHGPAFTGTDEVPRLAGQRPVYLRIQLEAFAAGRRAHPAIGIPFDRIGDFDAIAHYFAAAR